MSAKDGGAAFPEIETVPRDVGVDGEYTTIGDTYSTGGMTLRDYLAAKAMQGYCAREGSIECEMGDIANDAYELADAMLRARGES